LPDALNFDLGIGASILVDRARADAAAVGYAQGWAHGLRAARESQAADLAAALASHQRFALDRELKLRTALAALSHAANQLEEAAAPTSDQIEDAILSAAVDVAESLLGRELLAADVAAPAALARVLRLAPAGERITVSLSPEDHATLTGDNGAALLADIIETGGHVISLTPDASLQSGEAIGRTGATTIDARLSAGLQRLRQYVAR
jgi:flagellar assembly protein FliH